MARAFADALLWKMKEDLAGVDKTWTGRDGSSLNHYSSKGKNSSRICSTAALPPRTAIPRL
jgi:hypothetical protein